MATFDSLNTDEMILIEKEAILGLVPSIRTTEALEFRRVLDKQVKAISKRGRIPDIPVEWAGGPPVPTSPPAVIRREPKKGEIEVSNLERAIQAVDVEHIHEGDCCPPGDEPEHQEKLRGAVKKIYGDDSPLR